MQRQLLLGADAQQLMQATCMPGTLGDDLAFGEVGVPGRNWRTKNTPSSRSKSQRRAVDSPDAKRPRKPRLRSNLAVVVRQQAQKR